MCHNVLVTIAEADSECILGLLSVNGVGVFAVYSHLVFPQAEWYKIAFEPRCQQHNASLTVFHLKSADIPRMHTNTYARTDSYRYEAWCSEFRTAVQCRTSYGEGACM